MNKHNLDILGLEDGATKEEINAAYDTLRAKYLEDRFLDGEAGNNAAKMLTKIETAHTELLNELSEESADDVTSEGGEAYDNVEALIKAGNLQDAQRALDEFNERPAKWHYLQSVVFYRKNWINESKKQLEIAMQLDTENEKYKEAYKKLNDKIEYDANNHTAEGANQTAYNGQTVNGYQDDQMGGNICSQCITCCYVNMCVNCLCNMCCN
jgi:tetratricopeptide (TPR) repeat protein